MSSHPTISVITVCFNSEAYIADALRSVDIQTFQDREHLVIDGASTDATLRIVGEHQKAWRRVLSERDRGIYDAMNKGISLARGDIIGFINSDDLYASSTVLEKVAAIFEDKSIQACFGDLCYVRQNDISEIVRYWRSGPFAPGLFLRGWCPPHPTLFLRREVYEQFGGFDLQYKIASDVDLMARFFELHRIRSVHLPKVLVTMRMGGTTNRSLRNILQQNREIWRALKAHGLRPSLLTFVIGKLISRARRFIARPAP